jgi:hypothetical protein
VPKQFGTPGPRTMKPEVATDPALARCSLGAQLLFDRLIVNADDQGRQIGDPIVVKASCLPRVAEASLPRVKRWLAELAEGELIIRYAADGEPLLQLTGWWRHQDNQRRIFPSRWPAPEEWTDRTKVEPGRLPSHEQPEEPDWFEPPATGAPNAGHPRADGAPNAGHWPRKVSPSPMPSQATAVAPSQATATAAASASRRAGAESVGAILSRLPAAADLRGEKT